MTPGDLGREALGADPAETAAALIRWAHGAGELELIGAWFAEVGALLARVIGTGGPLEGAGDHLERAAPYPAGDGSGS